MMSKNLAERVVVELKAIISLYKIPKEVSMVPENYSKSSQQRISWNMT